MIEVGTASDTGKQRTSNQDRAFSRKGPFGNLEFNTLLIVADGMGGHAAGDVAAQSAIEIFTSALGYQQADTDTLRSMEQAAQEANRGVFEKGLRDGLQGMGTTFTAAAVSETQVVIAHIGDSRAYLVGRTGVRKISTDHSWVEQQVREGHLKPEEARHHPRRNVLTRALGIDRDAQFELKAVALQGAQALVLCSDGLYNHVADTEIGQYVREQHAQKACDALVALANERGGTDNITIVIATLPRQMADPAKTQPPKSADRTARLTGSAKSSGRASFWKRLAGWRK